MHLLAVPGRPSRNGWVKSDIVSCRLLFYSTPRSLTKLQAVAPAKGFTCILGILPPQTNARKSGKDRQSSIPCALKSPAEAVQVLCEVSLRECSELTKVLALLVVILFTQSTQARSKEVVLTWEAHSVLGNRRESVSST